MKIIIIITNDYPSFHALKFCWCKGVSLAYYRNNVYFIMKLFHKLDIKRLQTENACKNQSKVQTQVLSIKSDMKNMTYACQEIHNNNI